MDNITLEQVRVFLTVIEEGSFSAAARRLAKTQSAISHGIAVLERELGFAIFDRSGRTPVLTPAGCALTRDARAIARQVVEFQAHARSIARGVEAEVSIAIDAFFPNSAVIDAIREFRTEYPRVPLLIRTELLGAVEESVRSGACSLGIAGPLQGSAAVLPRTVIGETKMVTVVAAGHPLASETQPVPHSVAEMYPQLVLTDRSNLTRGYSVGWLGGETWRIADVGTKHEFLLAGLGWGYMPWHRVEGGLQAGRLVRLQLADWPESRLHPFHVIHRPDEPPGPAARWILERLRQGCDCA